MDTESEIYDLDPAKAKNEVWICQIEGRVSLKLVTDLYSGRSRTITVKGRGNVLRLTDHQRLLAQEQIEHEEMDPFKNGMLVRKESKAEKSSNELADDDLLAMLALDDHDFQETVPALSETNVRRLQELAVQNNATYNQVGFLKEYIAETYRIGGASETYKMLVGDR